MRTLAALAALALATAVHAQPVPTDPLKGANRARVAIYYSIKQDAEIVGIDTTRLRTVTELRLRQAGFLPQSQEQFYADSASFVFTVNIIVLRVGVGETPLGRAIATRMDLSEGVQLSRNRAWVSAVLWDDGTLNVAPTATAATTMNQVMSDMLDSFLNNWLKANPRRQP